MKRIGRRRREGEGRGSFELGLFGFVALLGSTARFYPPF
jgi:hypothetical protein